MDIFNLSIIIPVYNCEKYISKCLESVCEQEFQGLQVICINDSSQDNSLQILNEYAQKYDFIEVYSNKYNLGLATTRNRGIKLAKGKFIMFLDADDYIYENALKRIIEIADNSNVDILLYDMLMFKKEGDKVIPKQQWRIRKNAYNQERGIDMLCALIENNEMSGTVCGGIYRASFLNDNHIFFIDNILHEDIPFSFHALLYAKKIYYFHRIVYCYRQQSNSILHKPDYKRLLEGLAIGYEYIESLWSHYVNTELWHENKNVYIKQYLENIFDLMEQRYVGILESSDKKNDESILNIVQRFNLLAPYEIQNYIDDKNIADLKCENKVAIYGAGYYAKKIYLLLKKNNINVEAFYVTDIKNNPCEVFGLPVKRYVNDKKQRCIIIAVSAKLQNEIVNNIELKKNKIILINDKHWS